jgi:hypothetical protein
VARWFFGLVASQPDKRQPPPDELGRLENPFFERLTKATQAHRA